MCVSLTCVLWSQITRRYAEFSSAIVSINQTFPNERTHTLLGQLQVPHTLHRLHTLFTVYTLYTHYTVYTHFTLSTHTLHCLHKHTLKSVRSSPMYFYSTYRNNSVSPSSLQSSRQKSLKILIARTHTQTYGITLLHLEARGNK